MKPFNLNTYIENWRQEVNRDLVRWFPKDNPRNEILAAMSHSLHAGGKRLRPILCIAACEAVGGHGADALPACCALEMVHTYSLIHDDLPAMDDDQLRRGHPTCHIAFSEATAILAGDALVTKGFELLAHHAMGLNPSEQPKWLRIIGVLAEAAGHEGMIEGQMQDIRSEGHQLDVEQLERLHRLKTGALIQAAVLMGAIIGGATLEEEEALARYADRIGLAFQVQDDILNIEGDPEKLGKNVGTDHYRGKNTYPALLGLPVAKSRAKALTAEALRALDIFDTKTEPLQSIAAYIIARRR
ncbi:MAG: polyprenyl synthetase family protein [Desulfobacterales bacterium]|nr:polyprenyl synthetase family protein [Desulfobacterales bacterium]